MAVRAPTFPGFTPVSDRVYIRNEDAGGAKAPPADDEPTTILIYGWGDGLPKHVIKYVDGYHQRFPASRILVIISPTLKAASQSLDARINAMMPVVDTAFPTPADGSERVILHSMSNTGGIYSAATLNAYQKRHGQHSMLPHQLCVCDSTPGSLVFANEVGRWSRAMALGTAQMLPFPFKVTQGLWWLFLYTIFFLEKATGREPAGIQSCRTYLDKDIASTKALRLYLYSKQDDIIWWEDVEEQAAIAKGKGYETRMEMFEGSSHVSHMRMHPEQYWAAIERSWKESFTVADGKS
ncbi:DUF829-domain-containing protein [Xylariomycetidae sp. FL2044]|nr:DUF829-domain-containing protein [Xylariomycetidae sp. FL2044]